MPFPARERLVLLATPGIGPLVVQRLEEAGLDSFDKLLQVGVDAAVRRVCAQVGSRAWANRADALRQALGLAEPAF